MQQGFLPVVSININQIGRRRRSDRPAQRFIKVSYDLADIIQVDFFKIFFCYLGNGG